jgi:recombination protein RecA
MPNKTKIEISKIIEKWELGLTNSQISQDLNFSVKEINSTLNRLGKSSNKYEIINESKIIDLLIGSYLGDGHFTKTENNQQSSLVICHGAAQEDYFNWKCQKLKNLNLFNSKRVKNNVLFSKSKVHPVFTKFRKEGYDQITEKLNFKLIEKLNVESFAIWYLDDGSVTNDGVNITCQSLTFEDKETLKNLIFRNIELEVNVTSDSLYIPKSQIEKFQNIVIPYCVKSMIYKLIPYNRR